MTPGQATAPILWGLCILVPLVVHYFWRSYPLASLVAAIIAMVLDQVTLQMAFVLMQGQVDVYAIEIMFLFFPVALVFAFVIGLPFLLLRHRRKHNGA